MTFIMEDVKEHKHTLAELVAANWHEGDETLKHHAWLAIEQLIAMVEDLQESMRGANNQIATLQWRLKETTKTFKEPSEIDQRAQQVDFLGLKPRWKG